MPFPIQRIQTDRGREFFAEAVQQRLMDWAIKFRPIPAQRHRRICATGKVDSAGMHRTNREEFREQDRCRAIWIQAKLS